MQWCIVVLQTIAVPSHGYCVIIFILARIATAAAIPVSPHNSQSITHEIDTNQKEQQDACIGLALLCNSTRFGTDLLHWAQMLV